jgi:hypothetical protein
MRITLEIFNKTPYNPDGLINCLCQPGLLLNRPQKSIREKFNLLIKSCGTRTVPAAKTKPIGLHRLRIAACASAEASATRGRRSKAGLRATGVIFILPYEQLHADTKTIDYLAGLKHTDA